MTDDRFPPGSFLRSDLENMPSSHEAERGILSSFLLSPVAVGALCAERKIRTAHFFSPQNAGIFSRVFGMWEGNEPIDFITLTQSLRDGGLLDECGGAAYVTELFTNLPTAANVAHYLEIAEEKRILREIMVTCADHGARVNQSAEEPRALLDALAASITAIAAPSTNRTMTLRQALQDKIRRIEEDEPERDAVPTGLTHLDNKSPLRLGDMPLISGERKSGKSILALTIARNVATSSGPVLYFSLEDSMAKVTDRLVAADASIPIIRHSFKAMNEGELQRLQRSVGTLMDVPLIVRDDCYDLSAIVAVARQQKALTPTLKMVVVDYGQLVRAVVAKGANREQEMATVSRAMRLLSMELGVVVVVLVQLNKDGDTRESKAWEQDCTAMWKLVMLGEDDAERNGARILTVPFQRNGESGIGFKVAFLGHVARVENYADQEPP